MLCKVVVRTKIHAEDEFRGPSVLKGSRTMLAERIWISARRESHALAAAAKVMAAMTRTNVPIIPSDRDSSARPLGFVNVRNGRS